MKFLITGGSGYIGCAMQAYLFSHGHSFAVVDLHRVLIHRTHGCMWAPVDVRHVHPLVHLLRRSGPYDAVIHLAAVSSVPAGEADPQTCSEVNIGGTLNIITAAKRTKTPRIIFASSCAVYGETGDCTVREDAACHPVSQYGITKLHGERDLLASGLNVCALRIGNVAGGMDTSPGRLIPSLLTCLKTGAELTIHGDGSTVRDYVHVEDVCRAIRTAAENPTISGIYNIGSGTGTSIREVISTAEDITGIRARIIQGEPRPGDVQSVVLDVAKAAEGLPWRVERGLREMVEGAWEGMR